jgi:hypothetical protein
MRTLLLSDYRSVLVGRTFQQVLLPDNRPRLPLFDAELGQDLGGGRVMAICLHPSLIGHPYRSKYIRHIRVIPIARSRNPAAQLALLISLP